MKLNWRSYKNDDDDALADSKDSISEFTKGSVILLYTDNMFRLRNKLEIIYRYLAEARSGKFYIRGRKWVLFIEMRGSEPLLMDGKSFSNNDRCIDLPRIERFELGKKKSKHLTQCQEFHSSDNFLLILFICRSITKEPPGPVTSPPIVQLFRRSVRSRRVLCR